MLMTYGAEERTAGKYIGKVELIRGWYDDKDDLPAERMAKSLQITYPQFESACL